MNNFHNIAQEDFGRTLRDQIQMEQSIVEHELKASEGYDREMERLRRMQTKMEQEIKQDRWNSTEKKRWELDRMKQ